MKRLLLLTYLAIGFAAHSQDELPPVPNFIPNQPLASQIQDFALSFHTLSDAKDFPTDRPAEVMVGTIRSELGYSVKAQSLPNVDALPAAGISLITINDIDGALHLRVFDAGGNQIVDTNEEELNLPFTISRLRRQTEDYFDGSAIPQREATGIAETVSGLLGLRPVIHIRIIDAEGKCVVDYAESSLQDREPRLSDFQSSASNWLLDSGRPLTHQQTQIFLRLIAQLVFVEDFPASPQTPLIIPNFEGTQLLMTMETEGFRSYALQETDDLQSWPSRNREIEVGGNDALRTFGIDIMVGATQLIRVARF